MFPNPSLELWKNVEKNLLKNNFNSQKKLAELVKIETFKDYIAHSYLPRTFSSKLYEDKSITFLPFIIDLRMKQKKTNKIVCLEIGSFLGLGLKYMIKELENMGLEPMFHSVDLMYPYLEDISFMNYSIQGIHLLQNTVNERKKGNVVLHSGKSSIVMPYLTFPQGLDFAYLDGEHTSGGIYLDLALTFSKAENGTIIIIDDVSWKMNNSKTVVYGIIQFINDFNKYINAIFSTSKINDEFVITDVKSFKHGSADDVKHGSADDVSLLKTFQKNKTKQLIFICEETLNINLEEIMEKIKENKLFLKK